MLVAPLTGWLGDHLPRKPLIIVGAVLWSLATLGTAWVHDYHTLYIRHALVGVGEATFGIFAPAVLADFYPERDRNRILSIFYLAIPVGAALGYLAGGQMGTVWGWRAPFFVCAIPGLVIAALYGMARHASPSAAPATTSVPPLNRTTFLGLFTQPRLPHRHLRPGHSHLRHGRHLGLGARHSCTAPPGFPSATPAWSSAPSPSSTASPEPSSAAGSPSAGSAPTTAPSICSPSGASPSLCPAEPWSSSAPRLGHSRALRRRVLPLPQHRPAQRRHRQLGLRPRPRHRHLLQPLSAFTSSATPSPRRSSAPSPTAPEPPPRPRRNPGRPGYLLHHPPRRRPLRPTA